MPESSDETDVKQDGARCELQALADTVARFEDCLKWRCGNFLRKPQRKILVNWIDQV